MEIEKTIQQLAELERHVRELDTLIRAINSMPDEELKTELPRILRAHGFLQIQANSLPAVKRVNGKFLYSNQNDGSFRQLFLQWLWSIKATIRKAANFF